VKRLLEAVLANPKDVETQLVYADALEDAGDLSRAQFLRLLLTIDSLEPDDPRWANAERDLSHLRKEIGDNAWLDALEPDRVARHDSILGRRACPCFDVLEDDDEEDDDDDDDRQRPYKLARPLGLHRDLQDTECVAWKRVCSNVEEAALDGRQTFKPLDGLSPDERAMITTLPPTIAKLTRVTQLYFYGSFISRVPPEIGAMTSLSSFEPYTSYRLHWMPYEVTRCTNLRSSTVSTRALYGNFKQRWPFPDLTTTRRRPPGGGVPTTRNCSVCTKVFVDEQQHQHRVWISLRVATDVWPLLVNACSAECVANLPPAAEKYIEHPHRGGPDVVQPKRSW